MTISSALAKILNRLNILSYFNLIATVQFNGRLYKIPVLRGVGFNHLYLRKDHDYAVYDYFRNDIVKGIFYVFTPVA